MTENRELVNKYGEPLHFDRNFRGPRQRDRSCTDVPCLLLFVLFLVGWGFIANYAIRNGELDKLAIPTDMYNQKCGYDSNVLSKKYLFFFDLDKCIDPLVPLTGCKTPQICVEKCPSSTFVWETMRRTANFQQLKNLLICQSEEIKAGINTMRDMELAIDKDLCAKYYIKSEPFLNRCLFEFSDDLCTILRKVNFRNRRDLTDWQLSSNESVNNELKMQAAALWVQAESLVAQNSISKQVAADDTAGQCRRQKEYGEVIKEKMRQTNTHLAKLVGNFVGYFDNSTLDAQRLGEEIVEDLINSNMVIFLALLFTLIVSLIFIALMRWIGGPILWFSIIGVITGLSVGLYYSFQRYTFLKNTPSVPFHGINLLEQLQNLLKDSRTWLYLSIFLGVCLVVILLLVIVLRKRIQIAIALIKEGSKAVSTVISTVFFPIFSWVLIIVSIGYAIAVGLYLSSIGSLSFRMVQRVSNGVVIAENCICTGPAINYTVGATCDPNIFHQNCRVNNRDACITTTCSFLEIDNPKTVQGFIVYNVFGFLWLTFFISAFSDMVLAATFARWYWTFKKRDVPYFTLTHAFVQTAFYHLGTVAFGSLILAICRLIRIILEYIDRKLKKFDNAFTRAILCCMKCFFWLLETFLRFLNRNAYIMCAIHGKNFCSSAKDAFNLLMRNCLRVVTLDKVTDFLFFLSKLLLTAGAGVATYYFVAYNPAIIQLNYKAVPTTVVVIGAYFITSVFFGVYSMAVDTLFLCFLEDCERNEGTLEKPYFMSKQLMKILGKKNQFPQRLNRNK